MKGSSERDGWHTFRAQERGRAAGCRAQAEAVGAAVRHTERSAMSGWSAGGEQLQPSGLTFIVSCASGSVQNKYSA